MVAVTAEALAVGAAVAVSAAADAVSARCRSPPRRCRAVAPPLPSLAARGGASSLPQRRRRVREAVGSRCTASSRVDAAQSAAAIRCETRTFDFMELEPDGSTIVSTREGQWTLWQLS